jgi:hypothetical protein
MSITTNRTTLPPDAANRAFAARTARIADDDRRIRAALDGLSERYRSERVRLLGADDDRLLRELAAAHRRTPNADGSISRPTEEERRAARRAVADLAAANGIDLRVLAPLHAEMDVQFRRITTRALSSEVEVTAPAVAPPVPSAVFTSFGHWDAGGSYWFSNGSNWVERFDSLHLPAWKRTGSDIRMHMWNTDNRDKFHGHRNNGYLVDFTMPSAGRLQITMAATCAFTQRILNGDDEWGVSDCHVKAAGLGLIEVYSGWDDPTPDSQNYSYGLSGYAAIGGATEFHDTPVPAGAFRTATVTTNTHFPAGAPVLVYAATFQELYASVNDTSVAAVINDSWYVNWISVHRVP